MLVSTDKNKDTLGKYTELWNKIKDVIRSITNTSGNYNKKYVKIKFNSNEYLLLGKIISLQNMTIVVRSVFKEDNRYYPQIFLDEYLYEL